MIIINRRWSRNPHHWSRYPSDLFITDIMIFKKHLIKYQQDRSYIGDNTISVIFIPKDDLQHHRLKLIFRYVLDNIKFTCKTDHKMLRMTQIRRLKDNDKFYIIMLHRLIDWFKKVLYTSQDCFNYLYPDVTSRKWSCRNLYQSNVLRAMSIAGLCQNMPWNILIIV